MVGHKRERVLGRVGRAVNAAARDFAREAAQLENGGGREAAAERLVEQQVEVVALDKDRVVVKSNISLLPKPGRASTGTPLPTGLWKVRRTPGLGREVPGNKGLGCPPRPHLP